MGDQPQQRSRPGQVNDDYGYHGSPEGDPSYADAARNEIWHVHAKEGQTVVINRDDPRSADVIKHDEGGRFRLVNQNEFINRGGRIGFDPSTGEPYPPYAWQSHPNVPMYYETRPGQVYLPNGQPRVHIDVRIDIDGHGHGHGRNRGGHYPPIYRDRDPGDYRGRPPIYRDRDCDDGYRGRPPIYRDRGCDDDYRGRPPIYRDRRGGGWGDGGYGHGGYGRNRGGVDIRVGGIEIGDGVRIGGRVHIPIRRNR